MRVVVTGGCGFVGTNLVRVLLERPDVSIVVFDNFQVRRPTGAVLDSRVAVVEGDIRDLDGLSRAVAGADAIVHLAAAPGVADSVANPHMSFDSNAVGTLNALDAARRQRVRTFILASSNAVVGRHEPPMSEDKPIAPMSPYGAGKAAGEALCSAYHGTFGLETVALRFSNVYGPDCFHKNSVVAAFIRAALGGEGLLIYGDGGQTRDLLYVDDLSRAILAVFDRRVGGSTFHIGSGVERRIGDVADAVRRLVEAETGIAVPIRYAPARAGDVVRNYSSIRLATERLGFSPAVSLEDGLARTWQWCREQWPAVAAAGASGVRHGSE